MNLQDTNIAVKVLIMFSVSVLFIFILASLFDLLIPTCIHSVSYVPYLPSMVYLVILLVIIGMLLAFDGVSRLLFKEYKPSVKSFIVFFVVILTISYLFRQVCF